MEPTPHSHLVNELGNLSKREVSVIVSPGSISIDRDWFPGFSCQATIS
jgi:hypothetical protein